MKTSVQSTDEQLNRREQRFAIDFICWPLFNNPAALHNLLSSYVMMITLMSFFSMFTSTYSRNSAAYYDGY